MLVRKRSRMEAGVGFLGGGDWWKGWRGEDRPGMPGHDYRLSGPRTVNMKTLLGQGALFIIAGLRGKGLWQTKRSMVLAARVSGLVSKTLPIPACPLSCSQFPEASNSP